MAVIVIVTFDIDCCSTLLMRSKEHVMIVAGIDPGLSGGLFIFDTNTEEVLTLRFHGHDSVLAIQPIVQTLATHRPEVIYIERIFLAGREGGSSAMTIGSNYGRLTAVLDVLALTYTEVAPRVWQSSLGLKSGSRAITKQAASDLAVKRFGLNNFIEGRARKPHDGLTDAACIVLFAINKQSENLWEAEKKSNKRTSKRASTTATSASRSGSSNSKSTTTRQKLSARSQRSKTPKKSSKSNSLPSKKNGTV